MENHSGHNMSWSLNFILIDTCQAHKSSNKDHIFKIKMQHLMQIKLLRLAIYTAEGSFSNNAISLLVLGYLGL